MLHLKWLFLLYSVTELGAVQILMSCSTRLMLLDTENPSNIMPATIPTTSRAIAVDYHFKRREIYFSDSAGQIYRAWLGRKVVTIKPIVIVEVMLVDGLAVDWKHDNLYWADVTRKTIEMATLDGLNRRELLNRTHGVDKPRAVVLDPSEGLLFWSDWGDQGRVLSSGLDGKDTRTLSSNLMWPNGLTLDLDNKKLFIMDGLLAKLISWNYDGSNLQELFSSSDWIQQAFGLTYYSNKLYWTSWQRNSLISFDLASERTDIVYRHSVLQLFGLTRLMGLKVIHSSLQPDRPGASPCNKGCSHQCLVGRQGTASCVCPFGFYLGPDEKTCVEEGYLLVSWRKTIRRYDLDGKQEQRMIDTTKAAIALDYHFKKGLVFWSDVEDKRIYRAPLDQLNNKTTVAEVEQCDGLAVDWVHNALYWTDVGHNVLEAANLDGSHRTVLIHEDLEQPRAIALDPFEGLMFWSDWGTNPKIERAYLDGSNRRTIVNVDLLWPNGITIDIPEKRLYWVDGKLKLLGHCSYDGSQRKQLLGPQIVSLQPFGLSLLGDTLYWSDWGLQALLKTSKTEMLGINTMLINSSIVALRPNGIKVVHSSLQKEMSDPCARITCKNLCLGSPAKPMKVRCMVEEQETVTYASVTNAPEYESNELDNMLINVDSNSFQVSFIGSKKPSFLVISLKCIKREGCSDDKRCSEGDTKTQVFNSSEIPVNMTGLLPASKYQAHVIAASNSRNFQLTTTRTDPPELPMVKSISVKGTNVTISWNPVDTCVPDFESYNYRIYKSGDLEETVMEGSTNLTELHLNNLQPAIKYTVQLFTINEDQFTTITFETTVDEHLICQKEELMCDGVSDCSDGSDEDVNLCAGIKNVIVYKKTKSEAYFKCEVTNQTKVNLVKFSGNYILAGSDVEEHFEALAVPCVLWSDSFCFNISALNTGKMYMFNISAVLKDGRVGHPVSASVLTKEGVPGPPEDIHVLSYDSTNVEIQWKHPNQSNGVIRNFIISINEVEAFHEESCCMSFPIIEAPIEDGELVHSAKLGGLSPAATYAVSVTPKTLYLGGSREIDIHTPPPPMNMLRGKPELTVSSLTPIVWQPSDGQTSDQPLYHPLIKSYLLLLLAPKNDHQLPPGLDTTDIGPLQSSLEMKIGSRFSVMWRKNVSDAAAFKDSIPVGALTHRAQYQLAWVQVSQYKDVYGLDYILSEPFIAV